MCVTRYSQTCHNYMSELLRSQRAQLTHSKSKAEAECPISNGSNRSLWWSTLVYQRSYVAGLPTL